MSDTVDVLIIGGGFAGLSAAAAIVRQDHSILILDSGSYRNEDSKHMHTLVTWDHRDPKEFRAAARKDLERYGCVKVENAEVKTVARTDKGLFQATTEGGQTWTGRKLILATGVKDIFPDIPGYADCWVSGIFHCLYCHGWEVKGGESSGVLAVGDMGAAAVALHIARQGLQLSKNVVIYTNGNEQLAGELKQTLDEHPCAMTVDARRIAKFVKGSKQAEIVIHFEDGGERTEGFLAHKPKTELKSNFAEQLGLEMTPMSTVKINPPFNETSVKGVFAAGDISSPMQTVTGALNSGSMTGAGAPLQLQAETLGQKSLF